MYECNFENYYVISIKNVSFEFCTYIYTTYTGISCDMVIDVKSARFAELGVVHRVCE